MSQSLWYCWQLIRCCCWWCITLGLLAWHLDTPVVRSAGAPLCFLMGSWQGTWGLYGFFGEPIAHVLTAPRPLFLGFAIFLSCLTSAPSNLSSSFKFSARHCTFFRAWVQKQRCWPVCDDQLNNPAAYLPNLACSVDPANQGIQALPSTGGALAA